MTIMRRALSSANLLQASMATGLNGLIVADAYGLDVGIASGAIAWSTATVRAVGLVAVAAHGLPRRCEPWCGA